MGRGIWRRRYSWRFGRFDVYRVDPPLARLIATALVVIARPNTEWSLYEVGTVGRPEWRLGQRFINKQDRNVVETFGVRSLQGKNLRQQLGNLG
ncbi:MAG: hypothetical protein GXP27_06995 [Planctomycetes bacterium]|nr:hypothetical protein [Planctomycetota bacterium]